MTHDRLQALLYISTGNGFPSNAQIMGRMGWKNPSRVTDLKVALQHMGLIITYRDVIGCKWRWEVTDKGRELIALCLRPDRDLIRASLRITDKIIKGRAGVSSRGGDDAIGADTMGEIGKRA
jgi:hypothetical protein